MVVSVPGVMFWAVVLLVKWQGAPLRIIVARWNRVADAAVFVGGVVYSGGNVAGGGCCGGTW